MKKNLTFTAIAITVIAITASYVFLIEKNKLSRLPELSLHIINGKKLDLNSLKGKPALVTFWATTCTTCVKEIPHLVELYNEVGNEVFEIVAIAMPYDPPNRVVALSEKKKIPYPVALDIQGEAMKAFGNVQVTPTSFLIDAQGNIVEENKGEIDMKELKQKVEKLQQENLPVS